MDTAPDAVTKILYRVPAAFDKIIPVVSVASNTPVFTLVAVAVPSVEMVAMVVSAVDFVAVTFPIVATVAIAVSAVDLVAVVVPIVAVVILAVPNVAAVEITAGSDKVPLIFIHNLDILPTNRAVVVSELLPIVNQLGLA